MYEVAVAMGRSKGKNKQYEEVESLLNTKDDGNNMKLARITSGAVAMKRRRNNYNNNRVTKMMSIGAIFILFGGLFHWHWKKQEKGKIATTATSGGDGLPHLTCPKTINISRNDDPDDSISKFYESNEENTVVEGQNVSSYTLEDIENLKKRNYDGWSRNYEEIKRDFRSWKKRMFKSLKAGDSLIEIGCGRGFNLLMTLEILKEEHDIDNIHVYGVEYVGTSVQVANKVLQYTLPPIGSSLGSDICIGDASNLFYIQDESFDFVYTGHIEAIDDPLHLGDFEADDICDKESWAEKKISELYQKAQNDWYAAWTGEMIRIAKKGSPVIVEEIDPSLCEAPDGWGGVSRDWWKEAVSIYSWDVDVSSIYYENIGNDDNIAGRYRVFMKKNS